MKYETSKTEQPYTLHIVRHSLHWYVVRWRKYATFPILTAQILTLIWCNQII